MNVIEEKETKLVAVYDIETLASCFTYTDYNIDTGEVSQFVLHKDRFELLGLIQHLRRCKGLIGYNNINFDYPVIHFIIKNYNKWFGLVHDNKITYQEIILEIYNKAQETIAISNKGGFPSIKPKEVLIHQLDLFRVWHYNNKNRMTSLKSLEISMNYPNVMDMPISHKSLDITLDDIPSILEYNLNDVMATYEFYKKSAEKIALRKQIQAKYNISCINFSDSKIGESLMLKLYSEEVGKSQWDIKDLRTERDSINVSDILFDYIKFNSKEFNDLLSFFKSIVIRDTKGAFAKSAIYKGFKYDYGTGGIHGCIDSGIYESDDDFIIIDADVASLYPNIAIKNRLYIEHLGETLVDIYDNGIVQERIRAKRAKEMSISDALKLAANSVYGKSNDKHSFLYDPKYTMATTINGQLLLTMLAECLTDNIPDLLMIQANTDGITVKIPRKHQDLYYKLCKDWEAITNLELEYVDYSKMVIRDVNNYLAITTTGKVKYKGAFEVDKVIGSEPAYHKDNSFRIVPLAVSEYFTKGIAPEETIRAHTNIYDFCGKQKFDRHSNGKIHYLLNNEKIIEDQQKNVRYYISNKGATFVKHYTKGTTELINKGYSVTIFNKYVEKLITEYDINYSFYIEESYKMINVIENNNQLKLF